jgi:uncharacterized protein YmfQ (DUF2313 family)
MRAPILTAADFLSALQALMPRGRVWPRELDSVQAETLAGLAPTYERQTNRANYLLVDVFPATTTEVLPEWEETLGLPDPCAGEAPTIQQRRAQVVAKLTNTGGQSVAYFIAYAAALGFVITITEFTPFRMGAQRMGAPLGGPDWAHTWAVNAPLNTIVFFRTGVSTMGEALEAFGNAVLECEFNAIKPAHTILQFRYQ